MNLDALTGISIFGPAYREVYRNDAHAGGSVDRVLLDRMVLLCPETVDFLYGSYSRAASTYATGSRPRLELLAHALLEGSRTADEHVERIVAFCRGVAKRGEDLPLVLGGTEEEIVERGSDWCTDLARVACALCQVSGIPARIVVLANPNQAYSGHEIVEAYRQERWGAADPVRGVVYRDELGRPATAWDLMQKPELVRIRGSSPEQFSEAAIVNYEIASASSFDYTASGPNDYYKAVLGMAAKGWPGRLRWLFGEDQA